MIDNFINIFEMSPRDGLQNEKNFISTNDKLSLLIIYQVVVLKKLKHLAL